MSLLFNVRIGRVALAGMIAILAGSATAQPAPEAAPSSASNLNLPKDVTIFGRDDPNLRTATAVINGEIITGTDVDQRLALIEIANGGKVGDEERARLREQVLRNLIDEALQIQGALADEITISPAEIDERYALISRNFKRTPKEMSDFLAKNGSSEQSIKRQIHAEIAWNRLLQRRVQPFVNVAEEEVRSLMTRLEASKGRSEYRVGEIYLPSAPENDQQTVDNARRIIEQIRQGGSFQAYARQFSQASTAAVGGDLGWIRPEQLPNELATAVGQMQVGQIAGPVQVPGGFSIIYLIDQRQVLTADPRDAVLSLRQVAITFPPGMSKTEAGTKVEAFAKATSAIAGCGGVQQVANQIGADVVNNDSVRIRDLPPQLQDILLNLQIGQATRPFGSFEDGVRVLVLCGRDDPPAAGTPSFDAIMAQMEEQRVNLAARRYLRDLRRDAIVDYR